MELNRWTEKQIFYVLLGSATQWKEIHRVGREWLDQGAGCARPGSIAGIQGAQ
jgi:hypothetical protein